MKKILPWILVIFPAFVLVRSLPFKLTGAPETQHIFDTIGAWFGGVGLDFLVQPFSSAGAYVIGGFEAVAAILLLVPRTRHWGALMGVLLLSGAMFFHIATPLGVAVQFPGTSAGDPMLFIMAVVGWLCCIAALVMNADRFAMSN